ncbi:MAG: hypothetical protein ACFFBD_02915 [Candidatus Hodarchaeota archaeon]
MMFKILGPKDLQFSEDSVFDPERKIYMGAFSASLKHLKPSSLSLLGLLYPLSLELVLFEQKINIILYSLSLNELTERVIRAGRYLLDIMPSAQQLRGNNLKYLFAQGQVCSILDRQFWESKRSIYATFEIPISGQGRKLQDFLTWHLKRVRQGDIKIIISFFSTDSLRSTRKQKRFWKKQKDELTDQFVSIGERMKVLEFRGIEVLAQLANITHSSEREKKLGKAYSLIEQHLSYFRDAESKNKIQCRYPPYYSPRFSINQGIQLLRSILQLKVNQPPKYMLQAKDHSQELSDTHLRVKTQKSIDKEFIALAAVIGDARNRQVVIDTGIPKITRLALLDLVLNPSRSSEEFTLEQTDNHLNGPWSPPNFPNYCVFAFRAKRDNEYILLWLLTETKYENLILGKKGAIETQIKSWILELDKNGGLATLKARLGKLFEENSAVIGKG